jgi:hypothetical protein
MRLVVVLIVVCLAIVLVALRAMEIGVDTPRGMAFDRSGNLFVSHDDSIIKFAPDGSGSSLASFLSL